MKQELRGGNYSIFSRELQKNLREITKNNGRAILFINRKGLSTGLLCRECGHIIKCPNCDVPMVYHATNHQLPTTNYQLICHHCGQKQNPPAICPGCEGHKIKFIGTGTQKVEDELIRLSIVPTEMIVRMDLDVAPRLEQQQKIFSEFRSKKYQILIGTQLMLRDVLLPRVKIAAIMTIDPLLSLPDFRMNEQIMRIIDKLQAICSGKLILQTYSIDNFIIKNFLENLSETKRLSPLVFNKLFISEIQNRKELSLPPFSQIIKLTYSHKNQERAEQEAKTLKSKLLTQGKSYKLKAASYQVLGPAPAFIPRIKNRYVWQIMIKSKIDDLSLRNKLLRVAPSDWKTDVDPAGMI